MMIDDSGLLLWDTLFTWQRSLRLWLAC